MASPTRSPSGRGVTRVLSGIRLQSRDRSGDILVWRRGRESNPWVALQRDRWFLRPLQLPALAPRRYFFLSCYQSTAGTLRPSQYVLDLNVPPGCLSFLIWRVTSLVSTSLFSTALIEATGFF